MRSSLWAAVVCVLLAVGVPAPAAASECTACQYRARNCSAASSGSGSTVDDTSIDVCDAAGTIQVDDVFCDEDSCNCAADRQCVNLVVGCANLFQARSRRRCLGNDTIQAKFQRCAVDQGLTTLSETNLASDWVFFKQSAQCTSQDCVAVRQFHASGAVQCGHLLVAWKDEGADAGSNATYHFVVDGSRGSDLKPGTFHYSVPWIASTATLQSSAVNSSSVDRCYSLQTRNERNGSTCDGVYLEFDTSVQLSNSDNYVLSKLSWPVWLAVVGSVAVAAIAVGVVATVFYRLKRAERELDDNSGDGLLGELDDLRDRASVAKTQRASTLSTTDSGSDADSGIRQRAKEADEQEDKVAAVL